MEECIGTYTFSSNKGKSAKYHILVNDKMYMDYRGMHIDEERELLNLSDHYLARAWFKIGKCTETSWKKPKMKEINWIKKR